MVAGLNYPAAASVAGQHDVTLLGVNNGYSSAADQQSVYYNGKVYFAYVDGANGNVEVASYTEATDTTSTPTKVNSGTWAVNLHDSPSVLVRDSDHKILCAFTQSYNDSNCYLAISTNAEDATAFGAATDISASIGGTQNFTYMSLAQLTAATSSPIYLTYTEHTTLGYISVSKSTDGGATWGTRVRLFQGPSGQDLYHRHSNDGTKLHIFTTDTNRGTSPSALYHAYYEADTLKKSDGTTIGSLPVAPSSATLVKSATDGAINITGSTIEAGGTPAVVFFVYKSATNTNEVWTGRYRTGAWQVNKVCDTNGLVGGIFRYESAAAFADADADTVYVSRNVSGVFEMFRYTTADDGVTWSGMQLTTGSSGDACLASTVVGAADTAVIWHRGSVTSDSSYSMNTEAWRTA